jgi:hypothetical protein
LGSKEADRGGPLPSTASLARDAEGIVSPAATTEEGEDKGQSRVPSVGGLTISGETREEDPSQHEEAPTGLDSASTAAAGTMRERERTGSIRSIHRRYRHDGSYIRGDDG